MLGATFGGRCQSTQEILSLTLNSEWRKAELIMEPPNGYDAELQITKIGIFKNLVPFPKIRQTKM